MTIVAGYRARVLAGDFSLSAYINEVTMPHTVDMHDVTVFADAVPGLPPARKFIPGMNTSTFSVKGFLDPDTTSDLQYDQLNDWTGAEPVTYGPSGLALGSELWMVNALPNAKASAATNTSPVSFDLACQTDGRTDFGVSLQDLGAVTADGNGTTVDGAAATTGGGVAHLHVTAFTGFSGVAFTVEDSANDSVWATIGTFTTVAGLTSQRLVIAGTIRRYTRIVRDVTGTGSVTFHAGIARR